METKIEIPKYQKDSETIAKSLLNLREELKTETEEYVSNREMLVKINACIYHQYPIHGAKS